MRQIIQFVAAAAVACSALQAGVLKVQINGIEYTVANPTPSGAPAGQTVSFTGSSGAPDVAITFPSQITGTVLIRIFDSGTADGVTAFGPSGSPLPTLPSLGIGKLTIYGTASRTARINVLVADGDQSTFPPTAIAAQGMLPGLASIGGTSTGYSPGVFDVSGQAHDFDAHPNQDKFSGGNTLAGLAYAPYDTDGNTLNGYDVDGRLVGIIIPDPSFRRQTVLAAVINGDICPGYTPYDDKDNYIYDPAGRVEVGQVLRLAAVRTDSASGVITGGNINAHVIADDMDTVLSYNLCSPTTGPITNFRAIESITAGNAIRGKIIAFGRARDDIEAYPGSYFGRLFEQVPWDPGQYSEGAWAPACPGVTYPQWIDRGSIANVRVGPSPTADGIRNDIISRLGRIYSIRSTGKIKSTGTTDYTDKISISAADGVLEVRISGEDTVSGGSTIRAAALDQQLWANIDASTGGSFQHLQTPDYRAEGVVNLVDTKGQFAGHVACENLAFNPTITDPLGRGGIIAATATISADPTTAAHLPSVSVGSIAHNVCIMAYSLGPVHIGWHFKGTMVAFGTDPTITDHNDTGTIADLVIGDLSDPSIPQHPFYPGLVRGFVGGYSSPMNMRPGPYTSVPEGIDDPTPPTFTSLNPNPSRMLWDADRWLYARPTHPSVDEDGGSLDSVIRAEHYISGKPQIFQMTQRVFAGVRDQKDVVADYKPRLESPAVANMLLIGGKRNEAISNLDGPENVFGGLYSGVVWSGRLQYVQSPANSGNWVVDESHTAALDDFSIQPRAYYSRVGPTADLWIDGNYQPSDDGDLRGPEIGDDVCGELHINGQLPGWVLRIDGKLGALADWDTFDHPRWDDDVQNTTEHSPRGLTAISPGPPIVYEPTRPDRGAVRFWNLPLTGFVSSTERLEGPVVVNGWSVNADPSPANPGNPDGAFWNGIVRVGDPWLESPSRIFTLGPSGVSGVTATDVRPEYDRLGSDLSGVTLQGTTPNDVVYHKMRGGGVGVVPYALDDADCSPPNVTVFTNAGVVSYLDWLYQRRNINASSPRDIPRLWMRFYGSVNYTYSDPQDPDGAAGYIEWYNDQITPHVWQDATANFRTFIVNGAFSSTNEWTPFVAINPACDATVMPGIYRVRNWREVPGDPPTIERAGPICKFAHGGPTVADYTFYFRLSGTADIGQAGGFEGADGNLDNNDFIVFINWFFAADPRADLGESGGILGSDGFLDNNDFIAFITLYFSGSSMGFPVSCERGFAPIIIGDPYGGDGEEGQSQRMMQSNGAAPSGGSAINNLRSLLQSMIDNETDPVRRDQLQQMLNTLPPAP